MFTLWGDGFKVVGVDTSPPSTQVIKFQVGSNLAD
jgi:hypothetical protein